MAARDLIEARARKKAEQERARALELEAAREIVQPFLGELKGEPGPAGRDGVDGKDGRDGKDGKDGRDGIDGKDGKDADMSLLESIQRRLDSMEQQKSLQGKTSAKKVFEFNVEYHPNGLIKKVTAKEV